MLFLPWQRATPLRVMFPLRITQAENLSHPELHHCQVSAPRRLEMAKLRLQLPHTAWETSSLWAWGFRMRATCLPPTLRRELLWWALATSSANDTATAGHVGPWTLETLGTTLTSPTVCMPDSTKSRPNAYMISRSTSRSTSCGRRTVAATLAEHSPTR
jgi:hypothetical protein